MEFSLILNRIDCSWSHRWLSSANRWWHPRFGPPWIQFHNHNAPESPHSRGQTRPTFTL